MTDLKAIRNAPRNDIVTSSGHFYEDNPADESAKTNLQDTWKITRKHVHDSSTDSFTSDTDSSSTVSSDETCSNYDGSTSSCHCPECSCETDSSSSCDTSEYSTYGYDCSTDSTSDEFSSCSYDSSCESQTE